MESRGVDAPKSRTVFPAFPLLASTRPGEIDVRHDALTHRGGIGKGGARGSCGDTRVLALLDGRTGQGLSHARAQADAPAPRLAPG